MDNPKVQFTYSNGFRKKCEAMLKVFDGTLVELNKVVSGKVGAPDEYAVVNAEYKFRYISPDNIAEFASNLIKVLQFKMIRPNVCDMEAFAVESATRFVGENDCDPFEWTTMFEKKAYANNHMTLGDLIVMCQNEFFMNTVVSKFEMDQRRGSIKNDFDKLAKMKFSSSILRMVDAIPRLMNGTDFTKMEQVERDAIVAFIEAFIMFVTTINISTLLNMIHYCVPKSTYNSALRHHDLRVDDNSLLDNEYFKESVDQTKHKPIYVIFTDTKLAGSRTIKAVTHSEVNHASFALDPSFETVYTFNRKGGIGFAVENFSTDLFQRMDCKVYTAYVGNDDFNKMKKYIEYVDKNQMFTKYDWGVVMEMFLKKDANATDFRGVCSTFVNNIFKAIDVNITNKKSPSQEDLRASIDLNKTQFHEVYSGPVSDMTESMIITETKKFAIDKKSHSLNEYVTECCLLKTNNMIFNNKIPFNINMRNVVLQDMHPNFKDTVSAVNFILGDTRSPFYQMMVKYGSYEVKEKIDPQMIVRMFIGNPCCNFDNFSNYCQKYNELDFHSDVNWLDKITYGDPFQTSNYRADALGNDKKHPIQTTLEMLYKMYGDHRCHSNQELADNIEICGNAMIGIAKVYKDCGIINWELVRDILAVFGEIMTKCMIRLYNNHMTVIVASDSMTDTMIPGYTYDESFVEEFSLDDAFIIEDGDSKKPTVTVANANSVSNQNKSGAKQIIGKGREWLKQMITRFTGWITDVIAKIPQKFWDVHKAEIEWVEKHDPLNKEIAGALGKTFNPHIENWPLYKIPFKDLTDANKTLAGIINRVDSGEIPPDVKSIKTEFYNQFKSETPGMGLDVEGAMNVQAPSPNEQRNVKDEENAITNYILYGTSKPQATTTNNVTGDNFNDLITNIKGAQQVIKGFAEKEENDLKATTQAIKKRLDASKANTSWAEESYDVNSDHVYGNPYIMEKGEGDNGNGSGGAQPAPASGGGNPTPNPAPASSDAKPDPNTPPAPKDDQKSDDTGKKNDQQQNKEIKDTSQLEAMFTACQDISRAWCSAGINVLNTKFYRTSYNLYRDMVNAYKQTKGNFQDQPTEQKPAEPAPQPDENGG